jgi:hypothetical protein
MGRMGGMGEMGRSALTLHHPPILPILTIPPIPSHHRMLHITQIQLIPPHPDRLALSASKDPGDLHR